MYAHLKHLVPVALPSFPLNTAILICTLSCSGWAAAQDTSDPFSTENKLTRRPALLMTEPNPCADTKADHPLDLSAVVNIALCNNPQTREMWASSRAQAAQIGVSQASYFPSASVSLTGNRNTPGTSQRNIGLSLSYLLYDFGARAANLENSRQLLAAAIATQDNMVQTVFLGAVQAYYQSRATQAAFEAATVSERAAQESFAAANARYLAGSATPADKLTAQTAYSQATLNRITASGAMKVAQGNLANILGLDANLSVMLAGTQESTLTSPDGERMKILEQNIAALVEKARLKRPDLLAARAQVLAAQATADAARAAAKPVITMTAASNQSNNTGMASQGSSLGLSLSAPLFSGFAPTYQIRVAEAQIEIKKAQMNRIDLQVALDVWTAYQNLTTAMQNRRTTADLLESAEQSERVALGRYKAGAGIMLDLLNAQNILAGARQQRIQADLNWNISRATLAQAMGSLDAELLQTLPNGVINTVRTGFPPLRE
jgi:outer membrane protein